jgi:hypothetical protein
MAVIPDDRRPILDRKTIAERSRAERSRLYGFAFGRDDDKLRRTSCHGDSAAAAR